MRAPFGIDIVHVSPSTVSITFEDSAENTVPVKPVVEGDPAPGFVIGAVTADPATVQVVGAASKVKAITEAITEQVTVKGRAASFTETVAIGVLDPSARLRAPQNARVAVSITAAPVSWTVSNVVVQIEMPTARPTCHARP